MKKIAYLLIVGAVLAVSTASWAVLPPVTLDPTCSYVYDAITGFDGQASMLITVLGSGDPPLVEGLPSDWHQVDLENGMDGDGIPDYMQLGLLGAVLCAGEPDVLQQFNDNKAAYLTFIGQLGTFFADAGILGEAMDTTANDILTWLDTPQAGLGGATPRQLLDPASVADFGLITQIGGAITKAATVSWLGDQGTPGTKAYLIASQGATGQALLAQIAAEPAGNPDNGNALRTWLATSQVALGDHSPAEVLMSLGAAGASPVYLQFALTMAAAEIAGFVDEFSILPGVLGQLGPLMAGLAGLSSEMFATIDSLINDQLLGALGEYVALFTQLRDGCIDLALLTIPPMTAPLAAELGTLTTGMAGAITDFVADIATISLPTFDIYNVGSKTTEEPFSALADYNGNNDTNLQVYENGCNTPTTTCRVEFVAQASGASPYPGAPGLPVAGLICLSLLAAVCGVAGAFSIRKK